MMAPQVVGVLLKKPGQRADSQTHPRIPPLDPQETKIRGELYVEDLGERRMITIRMGWLWVEGTEMKLPLRALNLRQAASSLCQPHAEALGFTLSNSQNNILATFWADTEPIWWSWVRAIAAELVRQTPFRAQRRLNFLEILTICPRGPVPLPDSPTETRRRSRSELRPWFRNSTNEKRANGLSLTPEESRRRARSELRGWSSNSSDEDVLGEFRSIPNIIPRTEIVTPRPWAFSESSEGSDDSLPWSGGQSSVDSVDSVTGPAVIIPEPETREQRIQRYKETRRRENEARSRRVVEEDAKRRKARAEENNNSNNNNNNNTSNTNNHHNDHLSLIKLTKLCYDNVVIRNVKNNNNNNHSSSNNANKNRTTSSNNNVLQTSLNEREKSVEKCRERESSTPCRIASMKVVETVENGKADSVRKKFSMDLTTDRLLAAEEPKNSVNVGNTSVSRTDCSERRSRARERRVVREKVHPLILPQSSSSSSACNQIDTLQDRKDRLSSFYSRIPIPHESVTPSSILRTISAGISHGNARISTATPTILNPASIVKSSKSNDRTNFGQSPRSPTSTLHKDESSEEAVARLLERCQRVDHYVPVRDKLTLFESLSRLGGRLARSTEDLGRAKANPSPKGKQRARSLHDLNRAARSVPVREMCRLFEGEPSAERSATRTTSTRNKYSDTTTHPRTRSEGCTPPTTPLLPTRIKTSGATLIKASNRKKAFRDGRH